MLVLTRKQEEYIMIGDSIKIIISESNGPVRLAIAAPKDAKILRGELYEAEQQ